VSEDRIRELEAALAEMEAERDRINGIRHEHGRNLALAQADRDEHQRELVALRSEVARLKRVIGKAHAVACKEDWDATYEILDIEWCRQTPALSETEGKP